MAEIKANHICKNPECRKHYYACDYCGRSQNWRSVACSFACYQKYMDLVIAERSKGKDVEVKPERTDMTEQEVDVLMEAPIEEVIEKSKEDLKDFADINGDVDFAKAVDEINRELDKKTTARSKKKVSVDE
jgi:hypothetical protein